MFNIVVNIVTAIIVITLLILAVRLLWVASRIGKISGKKVFKELQKKLGLSDSERNSCAQATDASDEEKFGKRTYRHYKVSKDFLLKVYEKNDGRLEFVDRYQLKWSALWNKATVIVGVGAAIISTIWNIYTTVSVNKDGHIDIMKIIGNIMKIIGNTISNVISIIKPETIGLFGGIFILVILTFLMSLLVWKVGNDGFYDKIIKEILEENSEGGNAE